MPLTNMRRFVAKTTVPTMYVWSDGDIFVLPTVLAPVARRRVALPGISSGRVGCSAARPLVRLI
jgi:hypothetical protein